MFDVTYNLTPLDAKRLVSQTTPVTTPQDTYSTPVYDLSHPHPHPPLDAILRTPVLVELYGDRFEIPRGQRDYVLRNPRVRKVQMDRDWTEGVSRQELQDKAKGALKAMEEEERKMVEASLATVDRWHQAEGTVVPSLRAAEQGRRELEREGAKWGKYGVEMQFGLDIEALLAKGVEEERLQESKSQESKEPEAKSQEPKSQEPQLQESAKRKSPGPSQIPEKRVCLGIKTPATENRVSVIQEPKPKYTDPEIEHLLSASTILVTTKDHLNDIRGKIPEAVYLDVTDANKENSPQLLPYDGSSDYMVLVNRNHPPSVRTVLGMVKNASVAGGRWHVYNWNLVNCMNGNNNINWRNEHLWTYVNGNVY
jgi:hypothetical protein